jgi:hypothetical protein
VAETIDIPGLFKACAKEVNTTFSTRKSAAFNVYFQHGHYDAVNKVLIQKGESINFKNTKFPLIWMITPFQRKDDPARDYFCELSGLDFLVLMAIQKEGESIEDQVEKYFKPYLWPIVEEFKEQIVASGFFNVLSVAGIQSDYDKDWHYQSGLSGKNNLFNDCIVAAQIKNLRLRVNEQVPDGKIFG